MNDTLKSFNHLITLYRLCSVTSSSKSCARNRKFKKFISEGSSDCSQKATCFLRTIGYAIFAIFSQGDLQFVLPRYLRSSRQSDDKCIFLRICNTKIKAYRLSKEKLYADEKFEFEKLYKRGNTISQITT